MNLSLLVQDMIDDLLISSLVLLNSKLSVELFSNSNSCSVSISVGIEWSCWGWWVCFWWLGFELWLLLLWFVLELDMVLFWFLERPHFISFWLKVLVSSRSKHSSYSSDKLFFWGFEALFFNRLSLLTTLELFSIEWHSGLLLILLELLSILSILNESEFESFLFKFKFFYCWRSDSKVWFFF